MNRILKTYPGLVILLLLLLFACSTDPDIGENTYRTVAWESLTEQEKESVTHDPDQAVVNMDDEYPDWRDEYPFDEIPAVSVRFNTIHDALLGPITVYLDKKSLNVIGQAARM